MLFQSFTQTCQNQLQFIKLFAVSFQVAQLSNQEFFKHQFTNPAHQGIFAEFCQDKYLSAHSLHLVCSLVQISFNAVVTKGRKCSGILSSDTQGGSCHFSSFNACHLPALSRFHLFSSTEILFDIDVAVSGDKLLKSIFHQNKNAIKFITTSNGSQFLNNFSISHFSSAFSGLLYSGFHSRNFVT
ncbi:MAG: hypothetical protein LBQ24_00115 [Candidatus Peribacteria bacterium]|jgi:hypothetical protein|nr:hypothetical protein [Candidatus Peribacteria bacterium]